MKNRRVVIILLLLITLCLTACWDMEEITSLAPVAAIGVDLGSEPGRLQFSAQLSLAGTNVSEGGGDVSPGRLRVLTEEAESMQSAFSMMQSRVRRRLFYSHLNFVVVGADLAKSGLSTVAEAMQGWPTIRGSTLVFVAQGRAEEVLWAHSGIAKDPGTDITDIIRNVSIAPVARKMTINDMVNALSQPGSTSLTLPILDLVPLALTSSDESPDIGMSQEGGQFTEVKLGGTALFKQDRWVSELDVRETQTLAALVGVANEGASTMANPVSPGGIIAPQYEDIKIKHEIKKTADGRLQITVSPQLQIRLGEVHKGYDLIKEGIGPIEEAVQKDIRKRVLELLVKLQEQGLDSLGIGQLIERKEPKIWREIEGDWAEIYPMVEFDAKPKAGIKTTGMIKYFQRLGD